MKLTALHALVAAVEEGSLRGAARRLGVAQPALTRMMRELELELELAAPLLVRTSHGVLPTAQGKVLFEHAQKVTKELQSATDQISQLGGRMRGELHIGDVVSLRGDGEREQQQGQRFGAARGAVAAAINRCCSSGSMSCHPSRVSRSSGR